MTDAAYSVLADCAATAVLIRSHDRRRNEFDALAADGLVVIAGVRAVVTEAGLAVLRGMGR